MKKTEHSWMNLTVEEAVGLMRDFGGYVDGDRRTVVVGDE